MASARGSDGHNAAALCRVLLLASLASLVPNCRSMVADREDTLIGYKEVGMDIRHTARAGHWVPSAPPSPAPRPGMLIFTTAYGAISVRLRRDAAPATVDLVLAWIRDGVYKGCSFYRAEPAGDTMDPGQPKPRAGYALLQGGAYSCNKQKGDTTPLEPKLRLTRGTLALIPSTTEFFFSLEPHPDWDGAFSVWAEVSDNKSMSVIETIVKLKTKLENHPSGTVLRILETAVPYDLTVPGERKKETGPVPGDTMQLPSLV